MFLFPLIIQAQGQDTLQYKYGFLVEFEGATIQQIGFQYAFSNTNRIVVKADANYTRSTTSSPYETDHKNRSISASSIFEHKVFQKQSASLFAEIGIKAEFSSQEVTTKQSPSSGNPDPPRTWAVESKVISGLAGLTAEYSITDQFSVYCLEELALRRSTESDAGFERVLTSIQVANARIGLTIAF